MDPADFLTVAGKLHQSSQEAERRTSIGRSYYALYNLVHETLLRLGIKLTASGEDHQLLVFYLTRCPPRAVDAATVGQVLNDLRTARNKADYDMTATVNNQNSEFVFKKAAASFSGFRNLSQQQLNNLASCIQHLVPPPRRSTT